MLTHTGLFRTSISDSIIVIDYVTGISFAVLLYLLVHDQSPARHRNLGISGLLAGFFDTLYVVHMPLLVFLRAALQPDAPWMPDAFHVVLGGLIALAVAGARISTAEAKTDVIRAAALRWLARASSRASTAPARGSVVKNGETACLLTTASRRTAASLMARF